MARGQRINSQTPLLRPLTRLHNLRHVLIEAFIASSDEALEGVLFYHGVGVERVGRLNERLSHHRMARGQRIDPQTPVPKALRVP
eukprot:4964168-Prymnesium_polylepis.1